MAGRLHKLAKYDFTLIFLYVLLIAAGWVNIYSASFDSEGTSIFDFQTIYGKQLVWILLSVPIIAFVLAIDSKFYERFAGVIYVVSMLSLLGLFFIGTTISGQKAWYSFASFSIQPAEFTKATTALALAKFGSEIDTNFQTFKDQVRAFIIIFIPAILILLQPDPGMAILYLAFIFPLYREGLHFIYLFLGLFATVIFISTLAIGVVWVSLISLLVVGTFYFFRLKRKPKPNIAKYITIFITAVVLAFSVNYIFENVFKQHHRDRFNIILGHEVDNQGIGYNTNQSEIAVGSGGLTGKGWLQGTQTKGRFVPEQHTDYIFSTVGEEWGFIGAASIVLLFCFLIIRIVFIAERQKSQFKRIYAYSVAAIFFFHFSINIGMVIGISPTVGIPLPFISYGGSSLWGFTILLFILIRLDGQRMDVT